MKTILHPASGPTPGGQRMVFDEHSGKFAMRSLNDPGSFKTKEESKLSVLEHILQPKLYPHTLRRYLPQGND